MEDRAAAPISKAKVSESTWQEVLTQIKPSVNLVAMPEQGYTISFWCIVLTVHAVLKII